MKKRWIMPVAFVGLALLAASASSQGPDGKGREKGKGPPRFELGRVLPPFAYDQLQLTRDQKEQIASLEKEVKERLSKILTAEQRRKLQSLRPPGGPGGRPPDGFEKGRRPRDGDEKGGRPERPE